MTFVIVPVIPEARSEARNAAASATWARRGAWRSIVIPTMPLEDLIDSDHQARLVWDFCLGLDLAPLYDAVGSRAPLVTGEELPLDEDDQ